MLRILQRIGAIGVDAGLSRRDAKHVALTNQTAFAMALLAAAGLANPAYRLIPAVAACAAVQAVCHPVVLWLNHRRRPLAARLYFAAFSLASLSFMTLQLGDRSETAYFLPVVGFSAWLFYRRDEWIWPVVVSVVSLSTFFALSFAADPLGVAPLSAERLPPEMLRQVILSNRVLLVLVLMIFAVVAFRQTNEAEEWLELERGKSESLLRNILPERIAERLKEGEASIAERFDDATVLFADIVNFTTLAERVPPGELVRLLDSVFTAFDALADAHGLEKIKTIGDAYMVAGGIPQARADHARAVALMALQMPGALAAIPGADGLQVRIGVHCGPVVAGVIGRRKFAYDLWGDTVNTASRMESHGVPGRVHVSAALRDALQAEFAFEPRGPVALKGKGEQDTYFLLGPRRA